MAESTALRRTRPAPRPPLAVTGRARRRDDSTGSSEGHPRHPRHALGTSAPGCTPSGPLPPQWATWMAEYTAPRRTRQAPRPPLVMTGRARQRSDPTCSSEGHPRRARPALGTPAPGCTLSGPLPQKNRSRRSCTAEKVAVRKADGKITSRNREAPSRHLQSPGGPDPSSTKMPAAPSPWARCTLSPRLPPLAVAPSSVARPRT